MNWITEHNRDNVCDIVWWLKGYMAGAKDNFEHCPFVEDHLKTLTELSQGMRDVLNTKHNETSQEEKDN